MEKVKKTNRYGLPHIVRQVNLKAVIRQMRQMEVFSKIDLARELGISTTTMTKLYAQLETDHVIEKSPERDTSFGRPKILYRLAPTLQVGAIVIDVETTTLCFSDLQGELLIRNQISFPTGDHLQNLFARIEKEFTRLREKLEAPCRLLGVCIPGLIEKDSGKSMLNPNLHWLEETCPAKELGERLNCPSILMHEEKALNRAQPKATDDLSDYITIDFSAGVGMSVVANGKYLSGTSGFAGEIGHIVMNPDGKLCGCGNRGCLETLASDLVFHTETGSPMDEALLQLEKGEQRTTEAALKVIEEQAKGIAAVINIFNPKKLFVYSRLAEAYPKYIETLRSKAGKRSLTLSFDRCTIETTRKGKLQGALLLTIDQLIEQATF